MNWTRASNKLSALALNINMELYRFEVLWYRVMEMKGEWGIDRHTHSTYEVHIVANGSCKVVLDKGEFIAETGTFYMTSPGVYHEQIHVEQKPFIEYSLNIDIHSISSNDNGNHYNTEGELIFQIFQNAICKSYSLDNTMILEKFEASLKEADKEAMGYYNIIQGETKVLIVEMARVMKADIQLVEVTIPKKLKPDSERICLIDQYITDNLANKIRVSNIARHMYLSEKQINRIVRSHTGSSVKDLIMRKKLEEAKKLLQNTQLNQKEIASRLGFTSEYYFNQFFKREEGDTPGSFRVNTGNVRKY